MKLVHQLYLFAILCVATLWAVSAIYFTAMRSEAELELWMRHLANDIGEERGNPEELEAELRELQGVKAMTVTAFTPDGKVIGTSVEPPLPFPGLSVRGMLDSDRYVAVYEDSGQPSLVVEVWFRRGMVQYALTALTIVLGLFVVLAMFFARRMVKPLQQISDTAHRFGKGELSARAHLTRRDEIGEAGRAFDAMADRVSALMTSQKELMANVSHELRTPMARIQVALDLLIDGVAKDETEKLLPEISRDLAELERLVEDVMTVARLDLSTQGPLLRVAEVKVNELLETAASRFKGQHKERTLDLNVANGLFLEADSVLLRRVVENLLDNARKYSEPNTVIALSASGNALGVEIAVRDQGIGMSEADLQKVTTPFFRTDRSRTRSTGGIGLGLTLARRVVEAHGGTLSLQSAVNQGTTVTVSLPLKYPGVSAVSVDFRQSGHH